MIPDSIVGTRLGRIWHQFCPDTPEQFASFCGLSLAQTVNLTWTNVTEIFAKRFNMPSLGARIKGFDTDAQVYEFTFCHPPFRLMRPWHGPGTPPGGWLNSTVVGDGCDLDDAALKALLVLWEVVYYRGKHYVDTHH